MIDRAAKWVALCVPLILIVSCAQLGEPGEGEQKLVMEKLSRPDSIPSDWGKLVAVSSVGGLSDWAQLWLQDEKGIIRIVPYNVSANYLAGQARVIGRE